MTKQEALDFLEAFANAAKNPKIVRFSIEPQRFIDLWEALNPVEHCYICGGETRTVRSGSYTTFCKKCGVIACVDNEQDW